ncbi:primosomal replication protein N [Rodentibacter caecimuris]|uniref:Primosomal replication protein N n=1 Tax=Rodentibacter caecimuris TaxID=1796644 RepID=A0A9X8VY47_9PAST|nr:MULTISPECIES: primosomal replication protein PriC [Pasteurellaceae]AOF52530.1 Primosomal replication protein N'' [Pasteurellaceae bacterium NI1060]MCQ9123267.1 primosomal replication protein [Rodentibacter heylii]MCR1836957.1 primosomal replication protein [Pasteurella caecimuris]MCU0107059.1 primosomal replication protein [Pasteurella caecimuris]OOF73510.1 primosomal replication protein N [Rodentibacter heylii]
MLIQQLIEKLEQKVQQLYQIHSAQLEEKIFTKFDRTLFSENGQTLSFYFAEINQTLIRIKSLNSNDANHYRFMTEHLFKQCNALSETLNRNNTVFTRQKRQPNPAVKKAQHSIHKLPPRERLEKYYEALEQLNNLYQQYRDSAQTKNDPIEQKRMEELANSYKCRRQKCQEAIDLLEEYLSFKDEQKSNNKTDK